MRVQTETTQAGSMLLSATPMRTLRSDWSTKILPLAQLVCGELTRPPIFLMGVWLARLSASHILTC